MVIKVLQAGGTFEQRQRMIREVSLVASVCYTKLNLTCATLLRGSVPRLSSLNPSLNTSLNRKP